MQVKYGKGVKVLVPAEITLVDMDENGVYFGIESPFWNGITYGRESNIVSINSQNVTGIVSQDMLDEAARKARIEARGDGKDCAGRKKQEKHKPALTMKIKENEPLEIKQDVKIVTGKTAKEVLKKAEKVEFTEKTVAGKLTKDGKPRKKAGPKPKAEKPEAPKESPKSSKTTSAAKSSTKSSELEGFKPEPVNHKPGRKPKKMEPPKDIPTMESVEDQADIDADIHKFAQGLFGEE